MRGRPVVSRNSRPARPIQEPQSKLKSLPAPTGGWNTQDALAGMKPGYAVVMDNFYPTASQVTLRPGRSTWSTGMSGSAKSILTYNSGTASKMFAATEVGIYDVTTAGAVGAAVTTTTNGKWEFRNFRNSGGTFLLAVNGVDKLKLYDGATWTNVDGVSTPAITGVATTELTNIHMFKRRFWFIRKNTLSAWYLPTDAIGGAAVEFPMGPIFSQGGYLVAQESWTIDGGAGSDDYLVTVTSEGQLAVYQGTDPSSASTFSLVGVYSVGKPLGKRCLIKYGGDVLYLSKEGVYVLSRLLLSATIDRSNSLSDRIDEAFKAVSIPYANNFGWEAVLHPTQGALLVNVATGEGSSSTQYVMNNITKAWCSFSGWGIDCFGELSDEIYSAQGTKVHKLWTGTSDSGMSIVGRCQQAYFSLGQPSNITLLRPNITLSGNVTLQTSIDTDFALFTGVEESFNSFSAIGGSSFWDSSLWDSALWSTGVVPTSRSWLTNNNDPGIFHSFRLQCTTSTATLGWTSTDFAAVGAGIL